MARRTASDPKRTLRTGLGNFRNLRKSIEEMQESVSKQQPALIDEMLEVGVTNDVGILYDQDDPKPVAFVQQNSGSLVWDEDAIIDWLNKPVGGRKSLRRKAQSLVFDVNKWEALVASKEVPPAIARKLQRRTDPPKPFIRFGKPKRGETTL